MKRFIFFASGERIEEPSRSLLYGEGLFETFRWKGRPPVFFSRHLDRMRRGAEFLGIPFPGEEALSRAVFEAATSSSVEDAHIKLCLLSRGDLGFASKADKSYILVTVGEYVPPKVEMKSCLAGFRRHSSSQILRFKTTNYLENVLARRGAVLRGFDEAIFLNEREEVCEGTATNIFWSRGDRLFTPAVGCGILPGITREVLISISREYGIEVVEGGFQLAEVISSDSVFLTNSLIGISQVIRIEGHEVRRNEGMFSTLRNCLFRELGWGPAPSV